MSKFNIKESAKKIKRLIGIEEQITLESKCDCCCHISESSSEDMKKNGCDLCWCDSEYYPRHLK